MCRYFLLLISLAVVTLVTSLSAAQQLSPNHDRPEDPFGTGYPSVASPTPEMWFYMQQLRRYQDPAMAVRRKAEARAEQRRNRLAAMKWFGFSNSRPQASPTPWFSTYSPTWSGNSWDPYRWIGYSTPTVYVYEPVVESESDE